MNLFRGIDCFLVLCENNAGAMATDPRKQDEYHRFLAEAMSPQLRQAYQNRPACAPVP